MEYRNEICTTARLVQVGSSLKLESAEREVKEKAKVRDPEGYLYPQGGRQY